MKHRILKCIFLSAFLFFILSYASAIEEVRKPTEDDWRIFIQAQNEFSDGNYGTALALAEKAKELRRNNCAYKKYTLDSVFNIPAVKHSDDSLEEVISILKGRESRTALKIIDEACFKYSKEFFMNSFKNLYNTVCMENVYPEADFMLGKIYRMEGENDLALSFFKKAYENSHQLDIPEQEYDILYELADLSDVMGNTDSYETYLLTILKKDKNFTDRNSFMAAINKTIKQNKPDSVKKFFELYRTYDVNSIKACKLLCEYYLNNNAAEKALECAAFGSLTSYSRIYEIISQRELEFTYHDLKSLLLASKRYADIIEWGNTNNVWELFIDLAKITANQGYLVFSLELYKILAVAEPVDYWKLQAENITIGSY